MAPKRPSTFADGIKKNRSGADSNLSVTQAKHRASVDDPFADRSARNVAKARAQNWNTPNGKQSPRT